MKIVLIYLLAIATIFNPDPLKDFLDQHYQGGEEAFRSTIYQSIKYPKGARLNCGVGIAKTRIHLAKDGSISNIEYLNEFGLGVEEAISDALKETKGNWIATDTTSNFDLSFAFRLGMDAAIRGDIVITAMSPSGNNTCPTEKELLTKVTNYLKKKKYKKAHKSGKELLRRNPDSNHYKSILSIIRKELDK